jgi:hypothetical protein
LGKESRKRVNERKGKRKGGAEKRTYMALKNHLLSSE